MQGPGHIDQAKEQYIKELESLVCEYKAPIRALKTEVQELAMRPMLDQGLGLQVLREELTNEKDAVQEACRGTSGRPHHEKGIHSPPSLLPFALEEKEVATQKDGDKIEELRQTPIELGSEIKTCPAWCAGTLAESEPRLRLGNLAADSRRRTQRSCSDFLPSRLLAHTALSTIDAAASGSSTRRQS